MGLRAPGILIFLVSIILAVTVLIARFFGADVPLLNSGSYQFYGLLIAYFLLLAGNLGGI